MVGTGNYSNKCGTCRRRKLKCGEEKPICLRCQRAGIECDGYAKDFKWIDEGRAASRGRSTGRSSQATPKRSSEEEEAKTLQVPIRGGRQNSPGLSPSASRSSSLSHPGQPDQYLLMEYRNKPPCNKMESNFSAFSNDVCVCFTVKRLFDGGPGVLGCDFQTWLASIENADHDSVSYVALQSLSAVFFARMHGNHPAIMDQGAVLYGKALRQLSAQINDEATCFDHENVSATMILSLYETITYSNRTGWIEHAGGTGRLIEMRGPERHQKFPDHAYFLLCRFRIIIRSIMTRRRTFLEKEEWKTIPWAEFPDTKTSMHYLQDILSDLPGFCEDRLEIDAISARGGDTTVKRRTLETKLIVAFRQLVRWRWKWDAENPNIAREKPVNLQASLTVDASGPLFDSILHFRSLEHAIEVVLYNTTLLMFTNFYQDFTKLAIWGPAMSVWPASGRPTPTNPLALPSETLQQEDMTSEICRSVEYHLHASHASSGAFALMFPLRTCFASLCMSNRTREALWVIRLCKTIADATGFELSRHMFSLRNITNGQRIHEIAGYVAPEVIALVDDKEAEIL